MKKIYKSLTMLCCLSLLAFTGGVFGQDDCVDATALTLDGGPLASDNTGTTDENGPDEVEAIDPACWGTDGVDGDIWFSFTGAGAKVDVETANLDTQIAIYDACGGNLVACDDDGGVAFASLIEGFCAESGVNYVVEVEGFAGAEGPFTIELRTSAIGNNTYCDDVTATNFTDPATQSACDILDNSICTFGVIGCNDSTALNFDPAADDCTGAIGGTDTSCCEFPPANDACADAVTVICDDVVLGSTLNSTAGSEVVADDCGQAIEGPGVWYTFVGDGNEITASLCNSLFDTKIHVWEGSCGALTCIGANDDSAVCASTRSEFTWISTIGTDYYIHISGWNGGTGDYELAITCAAPSCVPPFNDVCGSAFPVADGATFFGTNVCAQTNDGNPACDPFASVNGVWYVWNSGANNSLSLDFAPAAAPVDSAIEAGAISVYSGTCAGLVEEFCDDFTGTIVGEEIVGLTVATDYYFLVWTDNDEAEGEFDLTITGGVSGCTTVGACNYDATATIDDGTCDLSCIGCFDDTAINYSADAINGCDGLGGTDCCEFATCTDAPIDLDFCYDSNETLTFVYGALTPADQVTLNIIAGTTEVNFDTFNVYDGSDNTAPALNTQVDGDFAGQVYTSTSGFITVEVVTDGSVSCVSGSQTAFEIDVYCGAEVVFGCTDPLAPNFDPAATNDDGSCDFNGCTDPLACNVEPLALFDDGSCCLDNCTTVTITDSFGDGGTTVVGVDDLGGVVFTLTLADGEEISEEFCIPDGCVTIAVTVDFFASEAGVTITSQDGVEYELASGSVANGESVDDVVVDFGDTGLCIISGCTDTTALNYNPDANADCVGTQGGTDVTCCTFPIANNECDGAIALVAGVDTDWDTIGDPPNTGSSASAYSCSPTLVNDAWFTYVAPCDMTVTLTSTSAQGGEVAVWEGDCAGDALTLVACGPNAGFAATTLDVTLTAGVTYYIQVGSNSDFGATSTGTILVTEGLCRGCTYEAANNYDMDAGEDDGSCEFEDCTCPGDFTGDGFVTAVDLTGFLGIFGQACPN